MEWMELLGRVRDPRPLRRVLQQVRRHQDAPGIDGMTGGHLEGHLKTWPTIRAALVEGPYALQPVKAAAPGFAQLYSHGSFSKCKPHRRRSLAV